MYIFIVADYDTVFPHTLGYDVEFDETAYSPDYQENLAVFDDIPEPREQDTQTNNVKNATKAKEIPALAKFTVGERYQRDEHIYLVIRRNEKWITFTDETGKNIRRKSAGYYGHGECVYIGTNQYRPQCESLYAGRDHIEQTPAPVEESEAMPVVVAQEVKREAWQEHTCDHCNGVPAWTHEQFIKGILLSRERKGTSISAMFREKFTLAQLWKLARFFGLNVPAIELKSEHKTDQKKQQIAQIIADEAILPMEHVYTCTYERINPPELPVELQEVKPVASERPEPAPEKQQDKTTLKLEESGLYQYDRH